jgi:ABC-type branched-subunit amino acid transport system substrate-binding protein
MKHFKYLLVLFVLIFNYNCSDDIGGTKTLEGILIGTILPDDVDESDRRSLAAVKMAVDEINDAGGIFGHDIVIENISPSEGDDASEDKAESAAKTLYNEKNAVALITTWSGLGGAVNDLSNVSGSKYENLVQCNYSATNPGLTENDTSDTFYRTVIHDNFQAKLMAKVFVDNNWSNIGIYYVNDDYGKGLNDALAAEDAATANFEIKLSLNFSSTAFSIQDQDVKNDLDKFNYTVDAVVIISAGEANDIVGYLTTTNVYSGAIVLSDGAKTSDMFATATDLPSWIDAAAGNKILGTEPDTFSGENSNLFISAFKSYAGENPDTYNPPAYDCAYLIAFSLLYAGEMSNYSDYAAEDVKENIKKFKEGGCSAPVSIGIGGSEFTTGVNTVETDPSACFTYKGASGALVFDSYGDRAGQGMATFTNNSGKDGWTTLNKYDENLDLVQ